MTDLHQWCAGFGPTRNALANVRRYGTNAPLRDPIRLMCASTGRTRYCRAAAERDELAPFQLVEWHSVPRHSGTVCRISHWRGSVRRWRNDFPTCRPLARTADVRSRLVALEAAGSSLIFRPTTRKCASPFPKTLRHERHTRRQGQIHVPCSATLTTSGGNLHAPVMCLQ
jgi:hypothetical protein